MENQRFSALIRYYAQRLRDPHAEDELWGFLWLLLATHSPPNDRYIAVCIRNEYIRLSKAESKTAQLFEAGRCDDLDLRISVKMAIENCTETQRKYMRALACGYSADEIGKLYGCSRQAVNQTKNRCREKLSDCVS